MCVPVGELLGRGVKQDRLLNNSLTSAVAFLHLKVNLFMDDVLNYQCVFSLAHCGVQYE